jgi:opacity protein-like surface antigen
MKSLLVFLSSCTALFAQPISVGIKGGVPLTDLIDTVSGSGTSVSTATKLYILGPTVELKLPGGFGVEADALYRRFNYSSTATLVDAVTNLRTTGNDWEFPLLVKKRFLPGPVHPFIGAGVAFSKLSGVKQSIESVLVPNRSAVTTSSNPAELKNDSSTGFVIGAGLDVRLLLLRITPEIRYTRWGAQHFNGIVAPGGSVNSNQSQAEFLVGFTF